MMVVGPPGAVLLGAQPEAALVDAVVGQPR
jgi:hypothetical protein